MKKRNSYYFSSPFHHHKKKPTNIKANKRKKGTLNIVKGSAKNEEQNKIESKLLHFA